MSDNCQQALRLQGKPYPRTCEVCGLGPCKDKRAVADVVGAMVDGTVQAGLLDAIDQLIERLVASRKIVSENGKWLKAPDV